MVLTVQVTTVLTVTFTFELTIDLTLNLSLQQIRGHFEFLTLSLQRIKVVF